MLTRVTVALLMRQGVVQATMVLCGVVLARALDPAKFGVYVLCTFLSSLLLIVGDLGLGAFLVRAEAAPPSRWWSTLFTVRQISDCVVIAVFLAVVPYVAHWYSLAPGEVTAIRVLSLILPLTTLALIPLVRCEREMRFGTIAIIESIQAICYATVVLNYADRGANGFVMAWITHALCGAVLYQLACGWRPAWSLDRDLIRRALSFSLPYQAAGAVHIARDGAIPLLVGAMLGASAVGIANWAQMLALSIVLGAYVVQRGLLPGFSRIVERGAAAQGELAAAAEAALFFLYAAILTLMGAIAVHAREIALLVFGVQWLGALPYFYAICALNLILPAVIVSGSVVSAFGRSNLVFRAMAVSVVLLWVVGFLAMPQFGLWGYITALVLSQSVLLEIVLEAKRAIRFRILPLLAPVVAWLGIVAVTLLYLRESTVSQNPRELLIRIAEFLAIGGIGVLAMLQRRKRALRGIPLELS